MYQKNLLHRNVLITPQEIIAKAPGSNTLDPDKYANAIEIAEERFIRPAIGTAFYDYLCDSKNITITPANINFIQPEINASYGVTETTPDTQLENGDIINAWEFMIEADQKLWKTYLWKLVAECVRFVAIPENYAQFNSQGINKNNPVAGLVGDQTTDSVGISLNDAKWLMDKWREDRINPLLDAMHIWLCKYKGNYPRYDRNCVCDDDGAVTTTTNAGGWITDLYDDHDDEDDYPNRRRCRC